MGASRRNFGCLTVMVVDVKYFRFIVVFLSLLEMLLSLLFYKFGSLYFFLDERSEVMPVSSLISQGGGEDLLISIGCVLFFILGVFNLIRLKLRFGTTDTFALFITLVVQAVSLAMIEVASFSISVDQVYGWILLAWFIVYAFLWGVLFLSIINRISGGRLLSGSLSAVG